MEEGVQFLFTREYIVEKHKYGKTIRKIDLTDEIYVG